ncbi:MAG: sulfotransferase [Planctomycetota bacterium]
MNGAAGPSAGGGEDQAPRLFAIFITHTHERIARSVMSMARQTVPPDAIVVSCDGDSEDIRAEIRRASDWIGRPVLLVRRAHTGEARPAQTRNNAVRAVADRCGLNDDDLLVFFDGDCMAPPGVLGVHAAALRRHEISLGWRVELNEAQTIALSDEQIGAGRLSNVPLESQRDEVARMARIYARRDVQRGLGLTKPHKPQVLGANFGVRASVYRAINGMDETFTGWGMEDDDIGRRVYASGGTPGLRLRSCVVLHQHHPTRSRGAWMENEQAHRIDLPFDVSCERGLDNPLEQPEPGVEEVVPCDRAGPAGVETGASDPFFVVGTGRCGSTLFQAMLMSHPAIRMPTETQYFEHLDPGVLGFGEAVGDADVEAYLSAALSDRARFFLDAVAGTADAYADAVRGGLRSAREQFLWICDRLTGGLDGIRLGEKTPQHWKSIDRILEVFPNARFVHLVRDPRDVVAGLLEMDWWENTSRRGTAKYWRNTIETALRCLRTDGERHMIARYEDLIERPGIVLRSVSRFVGVEFDPAMLDHRAVARRSFQDGEASYKGRTTGAIDRTRMGRYRDKLSGSDVRVIEATVGLERMELLGYASDADVARPVWSPLEPAVVRAAESIGLSSRSGRTAGGAR